MRNTIDHLKSTGRVVETVSRFENHFLAVDIICFSADGVRYVQLSARGWREMNAQPSRVRREILSHIAKVDVSTYEIPVAESVTYSPFINEEQEIPDDFHAGAAMVKISRLEKQGNANAIEALKFFDEAGRYFESHFNEEMGSFGLIRFVAYQADRRFIELTGV